MYLYHLLVIIKSIFLYSVHGDLFYMPDGFEARLTSIVNARYGSFCKRSGSHCERYGSFLACNNFPRLGTL